MSMPFQLGGDIAHILSSIGIVMYVDDGTDADKATYAAKQNDRNRFNDANSGPKLIETVNK